jgi:hypothetical protein
MELLKDTTANQFKIGIVNAAMSEMFDEVLKRGFHGFVRVELMITDGTIQRFVRSVERVEK